MFGRKSQPEGLVKVYAVRDAKIDSFMQPNFYETDAAAMRAITQIAMNPEHPLGTWPEDFSLYRLGSYDCASGVFLNETQPVMVAQVASLRAAYIERWQTRDDQGPFPPATGGMKEMPMGASELVGPRNLKAEEVES